MALAALAGSTFITNSPSRGDGHGAKFLMPPDGMSSYVRVNPTNAPSAWEAGNRS
jgi:hypothetical protein